jgi:hypothetical protein
LYVISDPVSASSAIAEYVPAVKAPTSPAFTKPYGHHHLQHGEELT